MRRDRRAGGGLFAAVAVIALLAGCAVPGDIAVVRNPGEFVIGTDGDGLPDVHLAPPTQIGSPDEPLIALDGALWRVQTVVVTDPVIGSTLVTATLENAETGEVVTRTLDIATLSPILGR